MLCKSSNGIDMKRPTFIVGVILDAALPALSVVGTGCSIYLLDTLDTTSTCGGASWATG
jgi:hypothetical protein